MVSGGLSLVTGASGFLGGRLAARLAAAGAPLRLLSRFPAERPPVGRVESLAGDIGDPARVRQAVEGVETVYHAAALVPGRGTDAEMRETNVEGTRHVVEACLEAGVRRLVFVSSIAAYGVPLRPVVDEGAPLGGVDAYGSSKSAAEAIVRERCRGRMEFAILRPCQIYGPGDGTGFTPRLVRLLRAPLLPVASPPRPFSLVHVEDVVDALIEAGTRPGVRAGAYNIASGPPTSLRELAEACGARRLMPEIPIGALRLALSLRCLARASLAGNFPPRWRTYREGYTHGSPLLGGPRYDISRAGAELGWRPKIGCREGLLELVRP